MAAIQTGTLNLQKVYQKDMLDITFDIEGIDLTGKTLKCQVREEPTSEPVIVFSEDDNSLQKTVVSSVKTTVRLYKESAEMDIPVLDGGAKYNHTIIMFTNDSDIEDTQTIVKGTVEIINQYTEV